MDATAEPINAAKAPADRAPADAAKARAILDAAARLIAESGIDNVHLYEVAGLSGVSVGTIQYYFGTREALIDKALIAYIEASVTAISSASTPTDDPWADIERMLNAYWSQDDADVRSRIWVSMVASSVANDRHRTFVEHVTEEWKKPFREVIRRGVAQGIFHPKAPVEEIVNVIVRLIDGFSIQTVSDPKGAQWTPSRLAVVLNRLTAMYLR